MTARNRQLIETWYYRMWNQWDKSVFPKILAEDIQFRGSLGNVVEGHQGVSQYMDYIRAAFPDFHNAIEQIISEADQAFARLTYTGTHRGTIFGIEPTGRKVTYAGAAVFTFRNDRIAEVWVLGDIYNLLQQLRSE
jgi:steroid delta-isomerase-like uncharacterized protein